MTSPDALVRFAYFTFHHDPCRPVGVEAEFVIATLASTATARDAKDQLLSVPTVAPGRDQLGKQDWLLDGIY
jgi:hypothetical protein